MEQEQIDCKILEGGVKKKKSATIQDKRSEEREALSSASAKCKKTKKTVSYCVAVSRGELAAEQWGPSSAPPWCFFFSRFHTCGAIKHTGFGFIQTATRHACEWLSRQSKEKLQLSPPSQKILLDFTQRAFSRLQTLFLQIHKYS